MLSALDELFHVASRNLAAAKHLRSAHLVHYAPHIERLVSEAPLRRDSGPRHRVDRLSAPSLDMSLDTVLATRTSRRDFSGGRIAAGELWRLCFSATGVRDVVHGRTVWYQRNAPNSGGLGSIEAFAIVFDVEGIPTGIHHFDSVALDFAEVEAGQFRDWFREDVVYQDEFAEAAAAIILVGVFSRLRTKYGIRGYRSCLIDAGHASENIYLAGTALGLSVCATTGFVDDELDEALQVDGVDAASLVVILVGKAASRR